MYHAVVQCIRQCIEGLQEEAKNIAHAVQHYKDAGVKGSEIAVLYPKHVFGHTVEEELLRQYIPCKRHGAATLMERWVLQVLLLQPFQHISVCGNFRIAKATRYIV